MALIYWNNKTLKDQALIWLTYGDPRKVVIESHEKYTLIKEGPKLLGINIKDASQFLTLKEGAQSISELIVEKINENMNLDLNLFDIKSGLVVGKVLKREEHPKSKRLYLLTVQADEELKIVTNSNNSIEGTMVVVAKIGSITPSGTIIKPTKVMGVQSEGMLCGSATLGLEETEGIFIPNNMKIGQDYIV